jgi:hypothetical protein
MLFCLGLQAGYGASLRTLLLREVRFCVLTRFLVLYTYSMLNLAVFLFFAQLLCSLDPGMC